MGTYFFLAQLSLRPSSLLCQVMKATQAMKAREEYHLTRRGVKTGRLTAQKTSAKTEFAALVQILGGTRSFRAALLEGMEEQILRQHKTSAANFIRTRPMESMPSEPLAARSPTSNHMVSERIIAPSLLVGY